MIFNSFAFGVFLPAVFVLYWALPHKYRWALLLCSSYYFYMSWNVKYVALIFLTTVVSYSAARIIEGQQGAVYRKVVLAAALGICFGILFIFKYFDFFNNSVVLFFQRFSIQLHPVTLNLVLPVGISFYTFQTASYVIDVFKGDVQAERHFGKYAAFISFFPQLVAGPIERAGNLLPQIKAEHHFDYAKATDGLKRMAWGYYKKLVIADTLAVYVDAVYNDPYRYHGAALLLATVFFTFQIYCDFSGYSDIAVGAAGLLGIDLMDNFKSPYFSASMKEFWGRWHISLSTWFRDYVYIPLGGSRAGNIKHARNVMLTFFASGLWHGANWTYLAWGGYMELPNLWSTRLYGRKIKSQRGLRGCFG